MQRRTMMNIAAGALTAGTLALSAGPVLAQEVTLKLHQFLPPVANVPAHILKPWAAEVEEASGGRIKIEHFDAMALGGRPPELMDQAVDGAVDIVWTLPGYTPGRFPRSEVFELPFMMTDAAATGLAFQQMIEDDLQASEYSDVKILAGWVHGPGVIHTNKPVQTMADMQGMKLRGPTRVINDLLSELGATSVGMPVPAIPESLSKGVIDGAVIPWEVTPSLKLSELVGNHTEFAGKQALYTAVFVLAMNRAKYESLPDDLRAILDEHSGAKFSEFAARTMAEYDVPGREEAVANGNNIVTVSEEDVAAWKEASKPVVERWIADMDGRGIDGQALIDRAKALIVENGG